MTRWEYQVFTRYEDGEGVRWHLIDEQGFPVKPLLPWAMSLTRFLRHQGQFGWELVDKETFPWGTSLVFKRPAASLEPLFIRIEPARPLDASRFV